MKQEAAPKRKPGRPRKDPSAATAPKTRKTRAAKAPRAPTSNDNDAIRCAIEDTGMVALSDGKGEIRLTPAQLRRVLAFLEKPQVAWKGAA